MGLDDHLFLLLSFCGEDKGIKRLTKLRAWIIDIRDRRDLVKPKLAFCLQMIMHRKAGEVYHLLNARQLEMTEWKP